MSPVARRPRLVAGNWKMHKTGVEGATLAHELAALLGARPQCTVVVCPPFVALDAVRGALRGSAIALGAQNLHPEPRGAFTGEISGPMLAAAGCRYVIVGHSERRHGMGEDDSLVARKLRAARRDGLTPIVCVGETLSERDQGLTADVLVRQIRGAYEGLSPAEAQEDRGRVRAGVGDRHRARGDARAGARRAPHHPRHARSRGRARRRCEDAASSMAGSVNADSAPGTLRRPRDRRRPGRRRVARAAAFFRRRRRRGRRDRAGLTGPEALV
jgi:triosephosphate isomerase